MTNLRRDAIELLEQIPEDKLIFMIQIMQGVKGLYPNTSLQEKESAFEKLEMMRKKVPDFDYDQELADFREGKYRYEDIN